MSLLYTTGRFVHALRPEILRAYLEYVMPELIPAAGKDGAYAAAYLEQLPEEERRRFDSAATDLYMLWQEPDILQREEELPDHIRAALPGEYVAYSVAERIVWLAVHAPDWVDTMAAWLRAKRGTRCHWLTRRIRMGTGTAARKEYPQLLLDRFAQEVSRYVFAKERRGQIYRLQHYRDASADSESLSTHPESLEQWTETGALEETVVRRTFDIIFVYRPGDGILSIRAPGSTDYKLGLCRLRMEILHGIKTEQGDFIGPRYRLDRFLTRNGPLYLPERTLISHALCVSLTYRRAGCTSGLRTIEDPEGNIGELLQDEVNHDNVPYELMDVQSIRLRFFFEPGVKRHRHVTAETSRQNAGINSLKIPPYLKRSMAAALEEWGITSYGDMYSVPMPAA